MTQNRIVGLVIAAISLILFISTMSWPQEYRQSPILILKPYFFPRLILGGLFLCGAALLIPAKKEDRLILNEMLSPAIRLCRYFFLFIVSAVIMKYDFLVAMFLTCTCFFLISKRTLKNSLLLSLLISVTLFSLFSFAFDLPLPANLFEKIVYKFQ